jgi:hypothetical protein
MTAKPIHIVFTLLLFAIQVKAQSGNQTSVSLGIGIAHRFDQGDYLKRVNDRSHIDANLNAQFEMPLTEKFHLTAGLSYVYFDKHATDYFDPMAVQPDYYSYEGPYTYFPVTVGIKYYPLKNVYTSFVAGSAFAMSVSAKTSLIYSVGAGVVLPFGNHGGLDFGFNYGGGYEYLGYDYPLRLINISLSYKYRF